MDTVKYNAIIREMIKNENEIRNQIHSDLV